MRTTLWLRRLGAFVALSTTVLLLGMESVYRWGIQRVGELPRLPSPARVLPVHRALWAAEEGSPMVVQPRWSWSVIAELADAFRATPGTKTNLASAGERLSDSIARTWLLKRTGRAPPWPRLSLGIWLTRHASPEQLAVAWGEIAYFGRESEGLTTRRSSAPGTTRGDAVGIGAATSESFDDGSSAPAPRVVGADAVTRDLVHFAPGQVVGADAAERQSFGGGSPATTRRLVGIDAAAREYFGVGANELSWAQSATIAGLPQSPASNDPRCHPTRALARRAWVLSALFAQGALTSDQLTVELTAPLAVRGAARCPRPGGPT